MNYNNNTKDSSRWKFIALIAICAVILCVIILLKTSSESGKNIPTNIQPKAVVPDTTIDTLMIPTATDSIASSLPDTLFGQDERNPYEAGYEDGYAAGCDDGVAGQNGMSYDDENTFRRQDDSREYIRGYKDGYTEGYDNGQEGKQFNIGR